MGGPGGARPGDHPSGHRGAEPARRLGGGGRVQRDRLGFAADPRYGPQETDEEDFSCFAGAGAFTSTPSDLVRFGIAIEEGRLLQPSTVQLLQASQRLSSGQDTGYGLGWDLETITLGGRTARMAGHDGELRGGRVASFMTFPDLGLIVAVTSNTSFADTSTLAVKVAEVFVDADRGSSPLRQ